MKNDMSNAFYTCPYCKEEYANPSDLAHCILSCEDQKKREEEARKKAELALAKETRKKEVEDALDNYQKLLKAYIEDYGAISITSNADDWVSLVGSKPWHWWF
jgi:hypothetical protein